MGNFLGRKFPTPFKELEQMVCRGGYYPPAKNAFVQRNGRYEGLGETFFRRRFPRTLSKNLLKGYGRNALSRGILPAAKLWWIFAEDSRVCKHPLLILGQNPPEFSPAGENSVPRQEVKAFDLKAIIHRQGECTVKPMIVER